MKHMVKIAFLFIVMSFMAGCSDSKEKKEPKKPSNRFELNLTNGQKLYLKKEKDSFVIQNNDKIILLDIFATWCKPCKAETKVLSDIQKRYKDKLKVISVSIEQDTTLDDLRKFAQQQNINYDIAKLNDDFIDYIMEKIGMKNTMPLPTMVLIKNGKIINYYVGATEEEFIISDIKLALNYKPKSEK